MKLLAVDTSTEACSAALYIDGNITQHFKLAPREHSHLVLGMVDDLLRSASVAISDIDAIGFGRGPGSFMGVRIAAGVVQGMAFAHSIPVIPVSTLAAIAAQAVEKQGVNRVLSIIDARMKEVYWGEFNTEKSMMTETGVPVLQLVGEERVCIPESVQVPNAGPWISAGPGWTAYRERFETRVNEEFVTFVEGCYPSAEVIARLAVEDYKRGVALSAAEAIPVYIRDNVAKKPASMR